MLTFSRSEVILEEANTSVAPPPHTRAQAASLAVKITTSSRPRRDKRVESKIAREQDEDEGKMERKLEKGKGKVGIEEKMEKEMADFKNECKGKGKVVSDEEREKEMEDLRNNTGKCENNQLSVFLR